MKNKFVGFVVMVLIMIALLEVFSRIALMVYGQKVGDFTPYWISIKETETLEVEEQFVLNEYGIMVANRNFNFAYPKPFFINKDGFRSRDFRKDTKDLKKKILLIGDSFTWGSNAQPLRFSFADLLDDNPEYKCYNAGIPGSDPAQYAAIARQYVDVILPQIVVVCFYTGNDCMVEKREVSPENPLYYQTNVGWLKAEAGDKTFSSAEEAYAYYCEYYDIKGSGFWYGLKKRSAFYTLLRVLFENLESRKIYKASLSSTVSGDYLAEIRQLCKDKGIDFHVMVIPEFKHDLTDQKDWQPALLEKYKASLGKVENDILFPNVSAFDYHPWPDGHWNNHGHRKGYEVILQAVGE